MLQNVVEIPSRTMEDITEVKAKINLKWNVFEAHMSVMDRSPQTFGHIVYIGPL